VSNLYRRSGLSRVECSLLLSSSTPSLFHRCSLSFAVVVQFGGLWLDVVPSKLTQLNGHSGLLPSSAVVKCCLLSLRGLYKKINGLCIA
jgi:hypothetical protein